MRKGPSGFIQPAHTGYRRARWGNFPVPSFPAAILILGLSGIIAQLSLLRELLITFLSNELSIGITLANWLLLEALGSSFVGRGIRKAKNRMAVFVLLTLLFSLAFPLSLYLARTWKSIVGVSPGEGVGLHHIFLSSFFILLPVSLPHGGLFAAACQIDAGSSRQEPSGIGRVYFLETVGTLAGGLLFTSLLITRLTSFQIAFGICLVNSLACTWLLRSRRTGVSGPSGEDNGERSALSGVLSGISTVLLALSAYVLIGPPAERIQRLSIQKQWPSQDVVHYENSIYGNVAVIRREGEFTFFSGGIPVITAPTPDVVFVEEFAHLSMLFHSHPTDVLVLSGGAGGVLHELLKHPVQRIDYAELDPLVLRLLRRFSTPLTEAELGDPRVHLHSMDGRLFLREAARRYDVIFVGLSSPQDLQTNRFFTREFFSLAHTRGKKDGMLAFSLPGSTIYLSRELRDLNACILNALRLVYPSVRVIPGDGFNLVLASGSPGLTSIGTDSVLERFKSASLVVRFLTPFHIQHKLDSRLSQWFSDSLEEATVKANEDFTPLGVYYSLAHWNASFAPRFQRAFARIEDVDLPHILAGLGVTALASVLVNVWLKSLTKVRMPAAIASTGFAGMILELALIFAFQALYGFVFFWVGLLVTGLMAGTAGGSLAMTSRMERLRREVAVFMKIEAAMVVVSMLLPLVFLGLRSHLERPAVLVYLQIGFVGLSFLVGVLIGMEFPLASKIALKSSPSVGGTAGLLYGADLFGGWAGGLVGGAVLLPVLGLLETCLVVAVLKIASLLVLVASACTPEAKSAT